MYSAGSFPLNQLLMSVHLKFHSCQIILLSLENNSIIALFIHSQRNEFYNVGTELFFMSSELRLNQ